jgi:osmotically-inducible protein OsmY
MEKRKIMGAISMAAALMGLAGCATERECASAGCAGDAQITTNVQSLFDEHPEIGTEVNVRTLDHVVYLSGFVSAGEMKSIAEDVARTASGVSKVVDTIAVTH